ncbi:MAG TPA: hypothetical protein VLA72_05240 [Anaerolineales bacterium]|nr:hypothetical protein [Anaerolineales bacterium]
MSIKFKSIWKKVGLSPVIGVVLIVAGYCISVDENKKGDILQKTGVVTHAVIISRNHIFVPNDENYYEITYSFKAFSSLDGEGRDYVDSKRVSRSVYNTPGCRDAEGFQQELLLTEGSLENCVETTLTVDSNNYDVLYCEGDPTNVIRNVIDCEEIQIIYDSNDPSQSWILGTQPSSSGTMGVLFVTSGFGIVLLGYSVYLLWKSRDEFIE